MPKVVECVPNFSEGRDMAKIKIITDEIESVSGVTLLDVDPGADTNRTVVTFIGDPESVKEAAFKCIKKAAEVLDMSKHKGAHARMGATDVCPFIPVAEVTMDDCVEIAKEVGKRVGDELGIPVYLYEYAASKPEWQNLAKVREGEYEALPDKMKDPYWKPDFGPQEFNPKTGATAISAREFLIAYNVNLNSTYKKLATDIAFSIRERGRSKRIKGEGNNSMAWDILRYQEGVFPCGLCDNVAGNIDECADHYKEAHDLDFSEYLKEFDQDPDDLVGKPVKAPGLFQNCKAVGWVIEDYNRAQISINLTNYNITPAHEVLEKCRELALDRGVIVTGSEIVGLVPHKAMIESGRYYLKKQYMSQGVPEKDILECAIQSMGLRDVAEFNIEEKIIGGPAPLGPLVSMKVDDFTDEVSRDSPAPGGGSIAALAGALGAALSSMVANLTYLKDGYEQYKDEMEQTATRAQEIKDKLVIAVDEDTFAFNDLMNAFGMPKDTDEQKKARSAAIQEGYKKAAAVPLDSARLCLEAMKVCLTTAKHGNKNSITDAGVGALMGYAGVQGAVYNVKINLVSIKDKEYKAKMKADLGQLLADAKAIRDEVDALVSEEIEK